MKVIGGRRPHDIATCTMLDDGRVVCGTYAGEIVMYSATWEHIRTIKLPGEEKYYTNVSIDREGMIVALKFGGNDIFYLNPDDGELVRSASWRSYTSGVSHQLLAIRRYICEYWLSCSYF